MCTLMISQWDLALEIFGIELFRRWMYYVQIITTLSIELFVLKLSRHWLLIFLCELLINGLSVFQVIISYITISTFTRFQRLRFFCITRSFSCNTQLKLEFCSHLKYLKVIFTWFWSPIYHLTFFTLVITL